MNLNRTEDKRRVPVKTGQSVVDWARMAALIDAEGCISICKGKPINRHINPRYNLLLSIANTNKRIIDWITDTFGGRVVFYPRNGNKRPLRRWWISSCGVEYILRGCLPHFIGKRDQADLALIFADELRRPRNDVRSDKGNSVLTTNAIEIRDFLYDELKKLKKMEWDAE